MPVPNLTDRDVTDAAYDYLVAQGIVRGPRDAGTLPIAYRNPRDGVPEPTETEPVRVGVIRSGEISALRYDDRRTITIDFYLRAFRAPDVWPIDNALFMALHDKRAWDMAGLLVIESLQIRGVQSLGSDAQGYRYVTEYAFEAWAH